MNIKPNFFSRYFTLYFYMLVFLLPLVFIQKCEDAYYLPKFALLAGAIQFFVPVLWNVRRLKLNLVDYSAFAFLVFFGLGVIFAPYKTPALLRLAEWAGAFAVFFYARHFLKAEEIKRSILLMICSSAFVALYAFLQAFNIDLTGWITDFSGRAFSSLGNPDFLGGFLVITIPLALYLGVEAGRDKLSVIFLAFLSVTLFLSQTRSSIAAFAAAFVLMLFLFPQYFRNNYLYLFAGLIAAILIIKFTGRGLGLVSRFIAAGGSANPDLYGRFGMWRTGMNMALAHPLFGAGAGSVKNVYCIYAKAAPYLETEHLHNDFMEIAAENGLVVFTAFITFIITVFYALIKKKETLASAAAVAVAAMCVQAAFNFPIFILDTKLYFFAIAGLALNNGRDHEVSLPQTAASAAVFIIMASVFIRMLGGSMYLNTGINLMPSKSATNVLYNLQRAEMSYYDPKMYYYFTEPLNGMGRLDEAAQYGKKFIEQSPCSKNGYMQYSITLAENGKMEEALKVLDKFLMAYPADRDALNNKGKMLYMSGQKAEAIKVYKQITSMYPDDETAHNNLYAIYQSGKMVKEAQAEQRRWNEGHKGN
jgi:O-antigen ligase